jgi:hypothetical protein
VSTLTALRHPRPLNARIVAPAACPAFIVAYVTAGPCCPHWAAGSVPGYGGSGVEEALRRVGTFHQWLLCVKTHPIDDTREVHVTNLTPGSE